ncbi:hypothetical protein HPP92_027458 [Vanilla planifolia]|uniref:Uncharacterized protein n=1 Tax=Vanilla planifolia TaxID=51239 RepID=A0A835PBV4_VANPL|nr:hypothetical protein HPP92_027458 [Vanilla planifolia]
MACHGSSPSFLRALQAPRQERPPRLLPLFSRQPQPPPFLPPSISHLLELVPCPLPIIDNLPAHVESTVDLPSDDVRPFLSQAYLSFEHHLADFLDDPSRPTKPDWIIYDIIATTWVPKLASQHGLRCAYFSLFNAAALSFFGKYAGYESSEELTVLPEWIPFASTVVFTPFEARQIFQILPNKSKKSDSDKSWRDKFMAIRTCREFEPEWLDLLGKIHEGFLILPVGFLSPSFHGDVESEAWGRIAAWLDRKEPGSVLFAAFGSEVKFTTEQIEEIASGLENSGVPFVWALREGSPPDWFPERIGERGIVVEGWVPQVRVLSHSSVGVFLTHGGWNSIVEGLTAGWLLWCCPCSSNRG